MKAVLLNLRGARLDAMGTYGGTKAITPHLDLLAAQSVVFDQHYANWLSENATFVSAKGTQGHDYSLVDSLLKGMRRAGTTAVLFGEERTQGCWTNLESWKQVHFVANEDLVSLEQPSLCEGVLQLAIDWLQQYGQNLEKWFLWVDLGALLPPWQQSEYRELQQHGMKSGEQLAEEPDPNGASTPVFDYSPFDTDEPVLERHGWRTAYAGVMQYLDDLIGQFLKLMEQLSIKDKCLLGVTSPVGQPLGDYSKVTCRARGIHEERCHLPLIIHFPKTSGAGRRIHHLTQPADWWMTLAELYDVSLPAPSSGESLMRFAEAQPNRIREYAVTELLTEEGLWEASIRTLNWSLVVPLDSRNARPVQLYRKPEDRWDMNNVISEQPDVAEHLELTLRRYLSWVNQGKPGEPPRLRDDILHILR